MDLGLHGAEILEQRGFLGGLALLMALESTMVPLPSELVMPFAGYLAASGRFSLWLVIVAGTTGNNAQSAGAFEQQTVPRSAVAPGAISDVTPIATQVAVHLGRIGQPRPERPGLFNALQSLDLGDARRPGGLVRLDGGGRAITAHHSVLLVPVRGSAAPCGAPTVIVVPSTSAAQFVTLTS